MAFFNVLEVALDEEALDWIMTLDAHDSRASAFFSPPGGTNLGIFGNGGLAGETGRDAATNG